MRNRISKPSFLALIIVLVFACYTGYSLLKNQKTPNNPTNSINADDTKYSDKLLSGFFIEPNQVWASDVARVRITPENGDNFINIKGYIDDINAYTDKKNTIEILYIQETEPKNLSIKTDINQSGYFHIKQKIDPGIFMAGNEILLSIKGDILKNNNGDKRKLSYIFNSIYFSKQ